MTDSLIQIEVRDDEVRRILALVQSRIGRLRPALALVGEIVLESVQQNFLAEGRPDKWPPLSLQTKAERARLGYTGPILQRRGGGGGLLGSLHRQADDRKVTIAADKIYDATMQFGAKRGQFGTVTARIKAHVRRLKSGKVVNVRAHTRQQKIPWGDIPARPFLMVQDEDWDEIREELTDFLFGGQGR